MPLPVGPRTQGALRGLTADPFEQAAIMLLLRGLPKALTPVVRDLVTRAQQLDGRDHTERPDPD